MCERRLGMGGVGDGEWREVDAHNFPYSCCERAGKGKFSILRVPGMRDARWRRWEGRVGVDGEGDGEVDGDGVCEWRHTNAIIIIAISCGGVEIFIIFE